MRVLFSSTSRTTDVKPAVPLSDIKRSIYSILTTALFFFDNFVVFPLVTARKQYFSAIYFVPKRFICSYLIRPYKKSAAFPAAAVIISLSFFRLFRTARI